MQTLKNMASQQIAKLSGISQNIAGYLSKLFKTLSKAMFSLTAILHSK